MVRLWALVLCLALMGCGAWRDDPLTVYQIDPAAFGFPVMTFATVPF